MLFRQRTITLGIITCLAAGIAISGNHKSHEAPEPAFKKENAHSNYQKPGAPVRLASQQITINPSDDQVGEITLYFEANGTVDIELGSTPGGAVFTQSVSQINVFDAPKSVKVPFESTQSLQDVNYVNVFVTFISDNGERSARALTAKIDDPSKTAQSPKTSSLIDSAKPIYMPATETITYP